MMFEISTHKIVVISVIVIILRGQLRVTLAPSLYLTVPICLFQTASFAIGNAAYHSDSLYPALSPAVPLLVDLLTDSVARTRANAAGESSYHMTFHNDQLKMLFNNYSSSPNGL